jgi:hypothetical protein
VPLILLLVLIPILVIVMTPFLLIQRYRVGSSRRAASGWMATLGVISMSLSALFFLVTAAFTTVWVPYAFTYSVEGFATGCVIGLFGLLVTRWEPTPRSLHYTPNRWLVLVITFLVAGRVMFGLYRSVMAAQAGLAGSSALAAFGVPQSLAAGGLVIGYYLAYTAGVRWRIRRWQRRALRPL